MSETTPQPVYLGLGSNIRPMHYLPIGLDELGQRFGQLDISRVFESEAVGFTGPAFYNLVVGLRTSMSLAELAATLRQLEYDHGRDINCSKLSSRTLDIDILTYGECHGTIDGVQLPRDEITTQAFVLRPFAEIAGELVIPGETQDLAALWRAYPTTSLPPEPVNFEWQGQCLPRRAIDPKRRRFTAE